ncbi:phosphoglycolate phosphatase [Tropicibacter naphthalenivorans]|uniref:Phosphoglycolate phosphatase n=1 Tax=Tropicibacter naphthalenivorans TaxID=441103 RepID=A0A0P1GL16_9RHOB|nr:phosphoglycolate phosphatase [Tropicibacter naphthalenivorans]CUH82437.1 Phosphoglycolate phosphatase, chromosomal [Tropicibacter naphthalenivorans]SMD06153.1 phosphoglycolate phosphatase [Tropicibacter naphthalenivorans]
MARIVFDLDGTLIDSAPDIHLAVTRFLEEEGVATLDLPTITSFIGNGLPHLVRLVINATPLRIEHHARHTKRVMEHYDAVNGQLTRLYPGVRETLNVLQGQGHQLGLCTNKPSAPTRAILDEMGLIHFQAVVGGDSLPTRKPDPDPLNAAFAELGEGPEIYVGDSEVDAETARRAHVPFLLFTQGYRKSPVAELPHSATFDSFAELPDLVAQMMADTA